MNECCLCVGVGCSDPLSVYSAQPQLVDACPVPPTSLPSHLQPSHSLFSIPFQSDQFLSYSLNRAQDRAEDGEDEPTEVQEQREEDDMEETRRPENDQLALVDNLPRVSHTVAASSTNADGVTALSGTVQTGIDEGEGAEDIVDSTVESSTSIMFPLHYAASRGQSAIARQLIQDGADLNARDAEGEVSTTHSWAASKRGSIEGR